MCTQKEILNEISFEHPKHMLSLMDKKIFAILCKLYFNISFSVNGVRSMIVHVHVVLVLLVL